MLSWDRIKTHVIQNLKQGHSSYCQSDVLQFQNGDQYDHVKDVDANQYILALTDSIVEEIQRLQHLEDEFR